jgi:hypothetical protein
LGKNTRLDLELLREIFDGDWRLIVRLNKRMQSAIFILKNSNGSLWGKVGQALYKITKMA